MSTLLLTGCSAQFGTPATPMGLTSVRQSDIRPASSLKTSFSLQDEILSGSYSGACAHSRFEFVAYGRAIGPIKGTFLAYGSWKVGPFEWQFQEQFKIKARTKTIEGSVVGTQDGGRSTCEDFKDKPLFYFAHHQEGRLRAVIGHDHFSRVFLEQFERGVKGGAT
ncbi:MAG TPA: hypothetical protein VMT95_03165 [Candidatus Binatia bacterium]|nr:hypothetical protein [Candidatus Binatia bacterium]